MKISNLPDHTRLELHNNIKKNLHKYYKGFKSGSLKYSTFVDVLLSKHPKPNWLKENPDLEHDEEFRQSLVQYIKNAMLRYTQLEKENRYHFANTNRVLSNDPTKKNIGYKSSDVKEKNELKKALNAKGYTLSIPLQFITTDESKYLKEYLNHGIPIPLGWEKVLNYIKKST